MAEQQNADTDYDEALADFMGEGDSDGGDHDPEETSGDDAPGDMDLDEELSATGTSDDGEKDERKDARARLVLKLADTGRQLTASNKLIKELEGKLQQSARPRADLRADRVGFLRERVAEALGKKTDDADVTSELNEILQDLVIETADADVLASNSELARKRAERERDRRDRAEKSQLKEQLDKMEAERITAERRAAHAQTVRYLDGMIRKDAGAFPLLLSQAEEGGDGDPAALVYMGLGELERAGHDLSTDEAATKAAKHVMKNLETYYRNQAERYAALVSGDGRKRDNRQKRDEGGRRKTNQSTITSARSAGGRGARPAPRAEEPEETIDEFLARREREDRAASRGRRR